MQVSFRSQNVSLSFCRFEFARVTGKQSYKQRYTSFPLYVQRYCSIYFTKDNEICITYYLKNTNPHLFKIRIQKQMGGTSLWYCKVSHVVFIILVVQIFCLKCIYHFASLIFSYLSFCRFTLLNIQKILGYHFAGFKS